MFARFNVIFNCGDRHCLVKMKGLRRDLLLCSSYCTCATMSVMIKCAFPRFITICALHNELFFARIPYVQITIPPQFYHNSTTMPPQFHHNSTTLPPQFHRYSTRTIRAVHSSWTLAISLYWTDRRASAWTTSSRLCSAPTASWSPFRRRKTRCWRETSGTSTAR